MARDANPPPATRPDDATPAEPAEATRADAGWPGAFAASATIAALCTLSLAYPTLQLLGADAAFFVARGARWWEPVLVAVLLCLAVPLAITAPLVLLRALGRRVAGVALLLVVGVFGVLLGVAAVNQATAAQPVAGRIALALGLGVGLGLAGLYRASSAVRSVLRLGWLVPLAAMGVFLLASPASRIVLPASGMTTDVGAGGPQTTPPIVLIVLDELPASSLMRADGQVDQELFPGFARLAEDGMWYRNATSVATHTTFSVPAILTGAYPRPGTLPIDVDHPDTLFALLGETYEVYAFESITGLCPDEVCTEPDGAVEDPGSGVGSLASDSAVVTAHAIAPASSRWRLPSLEGRWGGFTEDGEPEQDEETLDVDREAEREEIGGRFRVLVDEGRADYHDQFAAVIDRAVAADRPQLYFLHSPLPHSPWEYLPSGKRYGGSTMIGLSSYTWTDDEWIVDQGRQRHLLQAAMADNVLVDVIEALENAGVYDEAMMAVTSDHGISFQPGQQYRGVGGATSGDIESVPLFVKYPAGERQGVDDARVQTVDIVPTILDVLGVDDLPVDGRSLRRDNLGDLEARERTMFQNDELLPVEDDGSMPWERSLQRKLDVFGDEPGIDALYRFGPHADLVGRELDGLDLGDEPSDLQIVPRHDALTDVDPDAEVLPVHLIADVDGPGAAPGIDIAVAVNGKINAVGRTIIGPDDELQLRVLIPEGTLKTGDNLLQMVEVREDDSGVDGLLIGSGHDADDGTTR